MNSKNDKKAFWSTLPGILTAIATVITAIGGIIVVAVNRPPTVAPTATAPPIVSPTATPVPPRPTDTPTPEEPSPTPIPLVIDDLEDYRSDKVLNETYPINAPGRNVGQLSLVPAPNGAQGTQSVAFHYEIKKPPPDDYSGFDRKDIRPALDWSGYGYLRVWVQSDRSNQDLVIQFGEANCERWKYWIKLSDFREKDFNLPLDESTFEYDEKNSTLCNGRMDLDTINYYGFYVEHGGLGEGTIYLDYLRVSP